MATKKISNREIDSYSVVLDDSDIITIYRTEKFYYHDDELGCRVCMSRNVAVDHWTETEFVATCQICGAKEAIEFDEYL